jgi:hypothetical protein
MNPNRPDMSPAAVTQRLRRVAELVRIGRALAGPRRQRPYLPSEHLAAAPSLGGTSAAAPGGDHRATRNRATN